MKTRVVNKFLFLLVLAVILIPQADGQSPDKKDKKSGEPLLYFALGSHRIFFTPGDIYIKRGGASPLNFKLENVRGRDEGGLKWETAPQFSYTIGCYFVNKKFGVEYQYDHIKYFVRQNQVVRLKGIVEGHEYDKDTLITPAFFQMEHSDGGNYGMFNIVKWLPLAQRSDKKILLNLIIKAGVGFVNPKTNSMIAGQHRDDKYHLSGYVAGIETGLRINIGKSFFATGTFKGAYANYCDFLISNGRGKQEWFSAQLNYLIGIQFPIGTIQRTKEE